MKKSIAYLPPSNQKELNFIVENILKRLKQTEMIILFGSYARNDYVVYDEKEEFNKVQFFVSDYDILVVTSGISDGIAGKALDHVEDLYYRSVKEKDADRQPPLQFINEDIKKLNKDLTAGQYFYTQIKQEGIVLYDSGKFKLARRRKPDMEDTKKKAEYHFEEKFQSGNEFVLGAEFYYSKNIFKKAAFNLHQACENYYYAIRLVYTQKNNKQHNLSKLSASVRKYSADLAKVFPRDTAEEKRLFNLIKVAYVDGRYNPDFKVTKEDIDALFPKVELLRDITQQLCEAKIEEYGRMI
ncbi:MAG: HEPN domain-containing protein [Candidatus Azobacteroides sp.]|nr:HEPN domain-containing protein [Candidatus Azobacteroides sp.]